MRALKLTFTGIVLLACATSLAWADQIRGLVVEEVRVPSDGTFERTVALSLEEAAVLALEEETPFLEGIRVELVLSNELKKYFDSYALGIYKNVSPKPQRNVRFYSGEQAYFQYLPYLNRIYIQIPLVQPPNGETLPVGTYRLERPLAREDFPLLLDIPSTVSWTKTPACCETLL